MNIKEEMIMETSLYQKNKIILFLIIVSFAIVVFMAFPMPVSADTGPKASLKISVKNLPEGEVYLDLLVDYPAQMGEDGKPFGVETDYSSEYYNQDMIAILKAYNVDGWRPALVTGTSAPLWGSLKVDVYSGNATSSFSYFGVPSRFKIIVVTENGDVVVSNIVEKKAFQSVVDFDFATGIAKERSLATLAVKQFAVTLPITLAIEALVLLAFGFSMRQNWKPFLLINLCTQVGLHLGIMFANSMFGFVAGLLAYVGLELTIFIVEAVLFALLLKQHSKLRRVLFALSANAASFIVGLWLLINLAVLG